MIDLTVRKAQNGMYNGKRSVSEEYLNMATKPQVSEYMETDYGFQFWINPDKENYRADGKFGQYIIVLPKQDMVVAVQSLNEGEMFDMIWNNLIAYLK